VPKKKSHPLMYFNYQDITYRFELHTDPPEAMYWSTYKIKPSQLKIFDAKNKQVFGDVKEQLLNDIDSERVNYNGSHSPDKIP